MTLLLPLIAPSVPQVHVKIIAIICNALLLLVIPLPHRF
jgi:hypothetical protein